MGDDIVNIRMEKLKMILAYRERINQNVQEIIELIHKPQVQNLEPKNEFNEKFANLFVVPIRNNDVEIRKKIQDIIFSLSCIASLWREDKARNMMDYITSLQSLFSSYFSEQHPSLRTPILEITLDYVNSLILPIHENKKWEYSIEIESLLSKIKATIRSIPNT